MDEATKSSHTLSQRVRRTLDDLAEIQKSLVAAAAKADHADRPADSLLDLELAAELKCVVDELRRLLWAYVQALSANSGRRPEEVLEWYKMQLAVEMLRNTRAPSHRPPKDEVHVGYSFESLVTEALAITATHIRPH